MTTCRAIFRRLSSPMIIGLALCSLTTASFALGSTAQRAACTPDVFRLCSAAIPNTDRIISCMKANKADLSPACQLVFDDTVPTETASDK